MVSETIFDKNQENFATAQQVSQSVNTAAALGQLDPNDPMTAGSQGGAAPLDFTDLLDFTPIGPLALTAGLGAKTAAKVGAKTAAKGAANQAGRLISRRFVNAGIAATVGAFLAAASGIPQSLIGKEFNKWASDNNIDAGNLRLNAQIALYTTPVIDPVTGELRFLDNDAERLRNRMREAGIPKDLIELQMIQHQQERNANARFIQQLETGQIGTTGQSIEEQALAGETPIETLNRLQKEKIAATKEQEKTQLAAQQQAEQARQQQQAASQDISNLGQQFRSKFGEFTSMDIERRAREGDPLAQELMQKQQAFNQAVNPETPEQTKQRFEQEFAERPQTFTPGAKELLNKLRMETRTA